METKLENFVIADFQTFLCEEETHNFPWILLYIIQGCHLIVCSQLLVPATAMKIASLTDFFGSIGNLSAPMRLVREERLCDEPKEGLRGRLR